ANAGEVSQRERDGAGDIRSGMNQLDSVRAYQRYPVYDSAKSIKGSCGKSRPFVVSQPTPFDSQSKKVLPDARFRLRWNGFRFEREQQDLMSDPDQTLQVCNYLRMRQRLADALITNV